MLITALFLRLKVSVRNKFLMMNLSEGLDPAVFLSVTYVHTNALVCTRLSGFFKKQRHNFCFLWRWVDEDRLMVMLESSKWLLHSEYGR